MTDSNRTGAEPPSERILGLAERLRSGTAAAHRQAESTRWAATLASGTAPGAAYATYLAGLRVIYDALETGLADSGPEPALAALDDARLHRRSALRRDLASWGEAFDAPAAASAAQAYAARIAAVAESEPLLLAAHHYVRYLGDLSGGQVVAAAFRRQGRCEGLALYDFADLHASTDRGGSSLVPFLRRYRATLDAIEMDEATARRLIAEAVLSFELSTGVFEALAPLLPHD